jgi:hypothetical protein
MIKLKNILSENMLRFNTKNITEQQLDMFKKSDTEYWIDRPNILTQKHGISPSEFADDAEKALERKNGKDMIRIATAFLRWVTTDIYKQYAHALGNHTRLAPSYPTSDEQAQWYIDEVQKVNQDVIKNAITILKTDPTNERAMTTIFDTIDDLVRDLD